VRVRWVRSAVLDLRHVRDYIAADNPDAAERMGARIQSAVAMLARFPQLGRAGRAAGTRELVVAGTPYIAVYSVTTKRVHILAIIHSARKWPKAF